MTEKINNAQQLKKSVEIFSIITINNVRIIYIYIKYDENFNINTNLKLLEAAIGILWLGIRIF